MHSVLMHITSKTIMQLRALLNFADADFNLRYDCYVSLFQFKVFPAKLRSIMQLSYSVLPLHAFHIKREFHVLIDPVFPPLCLYMTSIRRVEPIDTL